ncbi:TlpA disulfide reductase family protein [Psychroserpens sp. SPM9]|uniref:TlpA family protein disulfide reductase n=1 Tax=Psychroserpens sp. SPM9 TaxID=2975598 RepID=UPI0021A6DBAC|nr:TlpA disulfide reductase family protein [Psychroserpens sp. SPM9]MDG5492020.1 TlpA disulfide reductase family protein [Psychroserpens sp. SPM9]
MKRLLIALCAISIFACKQEPKIDYAILTGKVENTKITKAMLNGSDFKTEIAINEDGTFSDTLQIPENGFYTLSIGREYTPMYLSTGDHLNVAIDAKNFDDTVTYTGEGSVENNYLAAKTLNTEKAAANVVAFYSMEEAEFKTKLSELKKENEALLNGLEAADETFLATEKQNLVYDNYAMLNTYVKRHGYYTKKEDFEVSEGFIPEDLKNLSFDDANAYKSSRSYKDMAFDDALTSIFNDLGDDISSVAPEDLKGISDIKIQALKNEVVGYLSSFLVSPGNPNMEAVYNFFINNSTDEDTNKKLTETYEKNKDLVKGKPSPQFVNYENHKGGEVSLTDLKGKYVYVDVWATWCGPCIKEIPSLKEVEKKFHNENIEFVSASIDQAKDHDKWVAMVNDKDLGGLQLMADNDWKSQFVQEYAIQGIPRFILIDPDGNIVSADAPRPSNPKLIELLEEELKMQP